MYSGSGKFSKRSLSLAPPMCILQVPNILAGLQNVQHAKRETDSLFCSGLTHARLIQQHDGQLGVKITLGSSVLPRRQWRLFTAVRRCKQKRMTISVKPSFCPPPPSLLFYSTEQNLIHCSLKGGTAETSDPCPLPLRHHNARNYVYLSGEVTPNSSPNCSPGLPRSPRTENCHTLVLLFKCTVHSKCG